MFANEPQHFKAVRARKVYVQDEEVIRLGMRPAEAAIAIRFKLDRIAGLFKEHAEHSAMLRIIINNQEPHCHKTSQKPLSYFSQCGHVPSFTVGVR